MKKRDSFCLENEQGSFGDLQKCRHESFCSTLEPGWRRFPAEWRVHVGYVIHHDAGNSGKMANGK